ncbi:MAG: DUF4138 domain-containing protein [candidate division KSB1 bacterium]|nr:DUF4138 domain-containing protein [candidate division KSB1 bacterium]MDZ7334068.1 DUF4138 domain-containing protein [candidate division KSB1 bacterium]MDZ7357091.1 DUF4138 domain-containing protein [candidate division KSB1 bacterium]MDZ7399556.1 DUF4138 domain-containing protein [candidate division KSB1 bacterium]
MKKLTIALVFCIAYCTGDQSLAQSNQVVRVAPGFATVVVCPTAPELVTVGNMDAFSVQTTGNYILIKPLTSKGTTNMFIKTATESFNLLIQVSETPDLEVRLVSRSPALQELFPEDRSSKGAQSIEDSETARKKASEARRQSLSSLNPKTLALLANLFKTTNRYTYSVTNSKVIFAVDHMKQIKDKMFLICTIINNSNIPYDVGYVRFQMIDYQRSYLFWKKKIKETELEPVSEYYNVTIKPHAFGRLLFVFDKLGYSSTSTLNIKCTEENGRRNLELEVPGSIIK